MGGHGVCTASKMMTGERTRSEQGEMPVQTGYGRDGGELVTGGPRGVYWRSKWLDRKPGTIFAAIVVRIVGVGIIIGLLLRVEERK